MVGDAKAYRANSVLAAALAALALGGAVPAWGARAPSIDGCIKAEQQRRGREDPDAFQAVIAACQPFGVRGYMTTSSAAARKLPEALAILGGAYVGANQPEMAIMVLERSLEIYPDAPGALVNLGKARFATGQLDGAIKQLSRAIDIAPDYAEAWLYRGLAKQQLAKPDAKPAEDLQSALSLADSQRNTALTAAAALNLARLRRAEGDLPTAIDLFARAGDAGNRQADVERGDTLLLRAGALWQEGRKDALFAARGAYRRALDRSGLDALSREAAPAHLGLARAEQGLGNSTAAIKAYQNARDAGKGDVNLLLAAGDGLLQLRADDDARRAYSMAVAVEKSPRALIGYARALERFGNYRDAERWYKEAGGAQGSLALSRLYSESPLRDPGMAVRTAQDAIAIIENSPQRDDAALGEANFYLSQALVDRGADADREKALAAAYAAVSRAPSVRAHWDQQCLARIWAGDIGGGKQDCASHRSEGEPALNAYLLEGMYYLRAARLASPGLRKEWLDLALYSFKTGIERLEQSAERGRAFDRAEFLETRDRLIFGHAQVLECVGLPNNSKLVSNNVMKAQTYFAKYKIDRCANK